MECKDQVSTSDMSVCESEGIELQIRVSSDTLPSKQNDPGSVNEQFGKNKYSSHEVVSMPKTDEVNDISSTECSNVASEVKSEAAPGESINVSVKKEESSCLLTESSIISTYQEKLVSKPVEEGNISKEKNLSQEISTEDLSGGEKFETTSNESSLTSSFDNKPFSDTSRLSSDGFAQKSNDGENALKCTGESVQTFNLGAESKSSHKLIENANENSTSLDNMSSNTSLTGGVLPAETLQSLCIEESLRSVFVNRLPADVIRVVLGRENESNLRACILANSLSTDQVLLVQALRHFLTRKRHTREGHLQVDADTINEKSKTNGNGESVSPDKRQPSTKTAGDGSIITKNSSDDIKTTGVKNVSDHGTADTAEIAFEKNVMNEQLKTTTDTTREETIFCQGAITDIFGIKDVTNKRSAYTSVSAGMENVTKLYSNIDAKTEILHLTQDENVVNEQATTSKTVVNEVVSNEISDVGTSEIEQQPEETEDDSERKAFFYMSSCSVPGMGKDWEWPSVSSGYHYQRPPRRMDRRRNTAGSRNCLGTQRCHYIILAVGVLGAILGCLTYHLQDYGIGPKVLRPIGASAAFLSFVVCAFSSVYLTYLSYYTQGRSSHNYQLLDVSDPVASMLIDTMPQSYNSDPRFYFTSSAAATAQQVFRETQSMDALDRRGYSWHQTEINRPFDQPGPSGYDPDSKRFKMDSTTSEGEVYEMKSMRRDSEKGGCKERNLSQASDSSHYTLADQAFHSNSSEKSENTENTPLLPKK